MSHRGDTARQSRPRDPEGNRTSVREDPHANHRVLRVNRREIQAAKEDPEVDVKLNFRSKMKSHRRLSQSPDGTGENGILISVNTGSEWAAGKTLRLLQNSGMN